MAVLSAALAWHLRRETSKLECEWQASDWNFGAPAFTLTLRDGVYTWRAQGAVTPTVGQFRVNPLVNPPTIDLLTPSGACLPGIYQVRAGVLTIVHGQATRPADFSDDYKNGEQPLVMSLHRVQDD
jgi:hypothetical protein